MSSIKKNKTARLHKIYKALQQKPMLLVELALLYQENNTPKSIRQIQRDLKEIQVFLLEDEALHFFYVQKRKYYHIEQKKNEESATTISSKLIISQFNLPVSDIIIKQNLILINDAINNEKILQIKHLKNDETGDNFTFSSKQIQLTPNLVVHHRNNYYLGGFNLTHKKITFYGIRQMEGLQILNQKYNPKDYDDKTNLELANRFGISRNIDSNIYTIKIEISNMLSEFIKNHYWHPSQKFIKVNGKTIMIFKCGINRELIGWLMQWMYNIKIVEPPILIDYFEKTLREIDAVNQAKKPLVYRNIFNSELM